MSNTRTLAFLLITIALGSFIISSCEDGDLFHDHAFGEATCTAPKTCECGVTEGEPLPHTFVDGMCVCGAMESDYIPPHVHDYEVVICDPTCTENGAAVYTCECGNTHTEIIAALGHTYTPTVTEPTCTVPGFTTYSCACGESYVSDETPIIDHTYTPVIIEPTCTTVGYTSNVCVCGRSYNTDEVPVIPHTYTAVVTEPTCTTSGYTTYTCVCGDSYVSDETKPSPHVYTTVVTEPTCTVPGYTTYTCTCGDTYDSDEVATVDHIDSDSNLICDFEGCTAIVPPAGDISISISVANLISVASPTENYYVTGVVTEIINSEIGVFVITDEAGDSILIRLPKNESGAAYYAWTTGRVTLGDTIQIYGQPAINTDGSTTHAAKIGGGVLTVLQHEHIFVPTGSSGTPTCECGAKGTSAE